MHICALSIYFEVGYSKINHIEVLGIIRRLCDVDEISIPRNSIFLDDIEQSLMAFDFKLMSSMENHGRISNLSDMWSLHPFKNVVFILISFAK
jgi:hypothetical protein